MRSLPSLIALAVLAATGAAQHTGLQASIANYEARLSSDVAEDGIGSIASAVLIGDEIVWQRAFGWADVANRIAARPDTIYRTGSISKSVTAVLLAQLVEKGTVELDDPVASHLPAFTELGGGDQRAAAITLRQLASHTSGLIREPRLRGAASGPIGGWRDKILASIPETTLQTAPGEAYSYSNIGYGILGMTLSVAADRPFARLVEDDIFGPLGMTSSTFVIDHRMRPRLAAGYANRRDGSVNAESPLREHQGRGYKVPNGGVYSTAADLCRFASGLCGTSARPILSAATRAEVLKVQTPENPDRGYGLGFSISNADDVVTAGHGGSVAGYTANLVCAPEWNVAVAIVRNYGHGKTRLGTATRDLLVQIVKSLQ